MCEYIDGRWVDCESPTQTVTHEVDVPVGDAYDGHVGPIPGDQEEPWPDSPDDDWPVSSVKDTNTSLATWPPMQYRP